MNILNRCACLSYQEILIFLNHSFLGFKPIVIDTDELRES